MPEHCHLRFIKPGLLTSIQDLGRLGKQSSGVPVGGAMDKSSMRIANWLVGNDLAAPVLELTLIGPSIEFQGACQIAIAGADMTGNLDNSEVPLYETIDVKSGSSLVFGPAITGKRAYLAIGGNWEIRPWLDSYSAASHRAHEITPQSIIEKDSIISIIPGKPNRHRIFDINLRPRLSNQANIGVIPGPEYDAFTDELKDQLWKLNFAIGQNSNRMGYRLEPPLSGHQKVGELISSAVLPGTIQITNEGQPIILMADAQTTGGYPRIGNVISAHMDTLGQLAGGDLVQLKQYTLSEARQALLDYEASLKLTLRD